MIDLLKSKVNRTIFVYLLIMLYIVYTKPEFIFSQEEDDINILMFAMLSILIAVILFFFTVII